jgi:hypothetical protein
MKSLRRLVARLFNLMTRRQQEERLREEIEEHISLQVAENLRAGLSPVEVRRQAMLKFGGVEGRKQDDRAEQGLQWIENWARDLRFAFALRQWRTNFRFSLILVRAMPFPGWEQSFYCSRSASAGSNRAARRAGAVLASNATTRSTAQAAATTNGSNVRTP